VIARAQLAAEALRGGFTVELPVAGVSMWPLLRRGDLVTIEPARRVAPGELAFVARGDGFVLHRVVASAPLTTRGDGCAQADPPHAPDALIGRAIAFRRRGVRVRLDGPVGRALSVWSRLWGPLRLKWRLWASRAA
jgi:hypothetical protein